jgi:predicted phage terminase large subunit-like protein
LKGNWLIRPAAGLYFKREYFSIVDAAPAKVVWRVRFWDRAATPKLQGNDPDATAGVLLSKDERGVYYVEDVRRMFASGHDVDSAILNTGSQDGKRVMIGYNQDPGSAGKREAEDTAKKLEGYAVKFWTTTGDKITRAKPVSSQAEAGNICIVRGSWNEDFLRELENFPEGRFDDQVDGLSGAFELGTGGRTILVA